MGRLKERKERKETYILSRCAECIRECVEKRPVLKVVEIWGQRKDVEGH